MKTKQRGLSPKLLTDLIVSVLTYLALNFGVELDEETSAAVAKVVGFLAGVLVGPGDVVREREVA